VDVHTTEVVRRIFEMVASGTPMCSVKTTLEAEEVLAPGGGRRWSRTTLREMIQDDSYRPHTLEELTKLLQEASVVPLDPEKRYGICWYGKRRTKVRQIAEIGPEGERISGIFLLRDGFYTENITSPREGAPARSGLGRSGICAMATPT
jgi:hypothetical protein